MCSYIYSDHFLFAALPSEFPPIEYEHERDEYKRVFDDDHMEYKDLQAELDAINRKMAEVDRELDDLPEGSPQFLVSCAKTSLCFSGSICVKCISSKALVSPTTFSSNQLVIRN